jgi:phosphohistidine phosphatase SixA
MRLYLINHAQAVPREEAQDMSKRPLCDKGRRDARNLAKFLKDNGEKIDRVLHVDTSWTRENAELLGRELGGVKVENKSDKRPFLQFQRVSPDDQTVGNLHFDAVLAGNPDLSR